mmetsp:Transcript_29530/g.57956  ORF Transcript_29530/g.57956 Transcript_29530/m.57956 type:complete len:422 (-) Transcript_29530:68-1333(-)
MSNDGAIPLTVFQTRSAGSSASTSGTSSGEGDASHQSSGASVAEERPVSLGLSLCREIAQCAQRRDKALNRVRILESERETTKALITSMNSGDVDAIEDACQSAEACGVRGATIAAARQRAQALREASLLPLAVHGHEPEEIERKCDEAAVRGVSPAIVAAARERASQLREVRLLSAAANGTDIGELERACEEAVHAGVSESAIEAARRRVRQLLEEQMLATAMHGSADDIERACDAAAAAGVGEVSVAAARRRAERLREAEARSLEQLMATSMEHIMDARARHHRDTAILMAAVRILDSAASEESRQGPTLDRETTDRLILDAQERMRHSVETSSEEACTICLEQLQRHSAEDHQPDQARPLPPGNLSDPQGDNNSFCMLPCRHIFHVSCVHSWLLSRGTCPNCRLRADVESNLPPQRNH